MKDERGSMTLWAFGLSLLLFGVGFLALDLWNAFSARSEAAGVADSAAIAGATALDEIAWRSGVLALDPATAQDRASTAALSHPAWDPSMALSVSATPEGVSVTVTRSIPFRFVNTLVPGQVATVSVTGFAEPGEGP
jgi:hypothetical protein